MSNKEYIEKILDKAKLNNFYLSPIPQTNTLKYRITDIDGDNTDALITYVDITKQDAIVVSNFTYNNSFGESYTEPKQAYLSETLLNSVKGQLSNTGYDLEDANMQMLFDSAICNLINQYSLITEVSDKNIVIVEELKKEIVESGLYTDYLESLIESVNSAKEEDLNLNGVHLMTSGDIVRVNGNSYYTVDENNGLDYESVFVINNKEDFISMVDKSLTKEEYRTLWDLQTKEKLTPGNILDLKEIVGDNKILKTNINLSRKIDLNTSSISHDNEVLSKNEITKKSKSRGM